MVIAYLPKTKAGGLNRLPLLLFGLGIVLGVDLQGLLLYNMGVFHLIWRYGSLRLK